MGALKLADRVDDRSVIGPVDREPKTGAKQPHPRVAGAGTKNRAGRDVELVLRQLDSDLGDESASKPGVKMVHPADILEPGLKIWR